jgi:hypothetical protein
LIVSADPETGGTIQVVGVTVEKAQYIDLEQEAQRLLMHE